MSLITLFRPKQKASSAKVRSSACRGYIVELNPEKEGQPQMLEGMTGRTIHFASLDGVKAALRRRGVRRAELIQHHACEELSALGVSTHKEPGIPLVLQG